MVKLLATIINLLTFYMLSISFIYAKEVYIQDDYLYYLKLDNNFTSILVQDREDISNVSAILTFDVGYWDEEDDEIEVAHYLEHLFFSSKAYLDFINNNNFKSSYDNAYTSYNKTSYIQSVPKNKFKDLLNVYGQFLSDWQIDEERAKVERDIVNNEFLKSVDKIKDKEYDDAKSLAFYRDTPFAKYDTKRAISIPKLSLKNALKFRDKWYGASNATLYVYGNINVDEWQNAVVNNFSNWPNKNTPKRFWQKHKINRNGFKFTKQQKENFSDRVILYYYWQELIDNHISIKEDFINGIAIDIIDIYAKNSFEEYMLYENDFADSSGMFLHNEIPGIESLIIYAKSNKHGNVNIMENAIENFISSLKSYQIDEELWQLIIATEKSQIEELWNNEEELFYFVNRKLDQGHEISDILELRQTLSKITKQDVEKAIAKIAQGKVFFIEHMLANNNEVTNEK